MIRHQIYSLLLIICTSQSIRTMENTVTTADDFGVTADESSEANYCSKTLTLLGRRLNRLDNDLETRLLALERNMQTTISREYVDEQLRVQQERITSLMLSLDQLDRRINGMQETFATKQEVSALQNQINANVTNLQNQINTANSGISSLQAGLNNVSNNLLANVTNLQNQINVINAGLSNICNLVIPNLFVTLDAICGNYSGKGYSDNRNGICSLKPYYDQRAKDFLNEVSHGYMTKL